MSASQNEFLPINSYVCAHIERKWRKKREEKEIPDCCIMEMVLSHEKFRSCKNIYEYEKKRKTREVKIMALS